MQFTKAEQYGMTGALYLAQNGKDRVTPLSEISEAMDIPEKFLAKIFQSLSRSGVVMSHRGVHGGFTLARSPEEIAVGDILKSIGGPCSLLECVGNPDICARKEHCAVQELAKQTEIALCEFLDRHSLADLVRWEEKHGTSPLGQN